MYCRGDKWSLEYIVIHIIYTDVDECQTNSNDCDANAVCHDQEGSYTCKCKDGFTGDGFNCSGKYHHINFTAWNTLEAKISFSASREDRNLKLE